MRFLTLVILALLCSACQPDNNEPTDYQTELANIDQKIAVIHSELATAPTDSSRITELIYRLYQRASLSGDFADYKTVDTTIDKALKEQGPSEELILFKANLDFKLHRLENAKAGLELLADRSQHSQIAVLSADIAFQEGSYHAALAAYESLVANNRSWDNLARLAYYKAKTGHPAEADKLYAEAGELVSVKEMRSFAWLELQHGLLDLDFKRYDEALEHYKLADSAYSGYWLIEEHLAEALNLTGKTDAAIALYQKIIDKTQNPEFISALADIIYSDDPQVASAFYKQADKLFEARYALYPDAARGHFIVYLLGREEIDPRLLKFAERNHKVRPNAKAKFLLVQSLRKTQDETAARELMQDILETPWRTPDIQIAASQMGLL